MMRNRPRGGGKAGGGGGGGAGLLGEGPGMSTGMKMMMSGSGEGGLLGNGPMQGRQGMQHQQNQGRMPAHPNHDRMPQRPNQDRMPQRPNQDRMHQPTRQPRSLLGTPDMMEESHMRPGGRPDHSQERHTYGGGGGGHVAETEYYEEPEQTRGYVEEEHYAQQHQQQQRYEDPGSLYDHAQEVDHYAAHEQELDYGGRPPARRMNATRAPLVGRAPNEHQEDMHWDTPISQPDQRELMQKAADQVRRQRSPRSLLDTPYGGNREPHGRRVDQPHEMQAFSEERRHMDEFYEESKHAGGYHDEDPYAQGYEPAPRRDADRASLNARGERRSRFEPPRPVVRKTKQIELMEKADLQLKLLEEEKRVEQEQRERMAMLQQQQALILQQQQQQQMHMQQQQLQQQQKMHLMQQQAGILGNMPSMASSQANMGVIPSIFDLPTGSKTALGKRPAAMSRDDNKKLRRGPGDRWERTRSLSGNRDKKPLPSSNRRDLPRTRRDRASELRSRAIRGNNRRGDRKNSVPTRGRDEGRDKDRNSRSSNRERSNSSRSTSRSVKSKEGSVDKSKDKKVDATTDKGKKSEEYDPAEPTGEVITDKSTEDVTIDVKTATEADNKDEKTEEKKDAEISLTVTVNKKGRSVNDSDKKDDGNKESPSKTKKYKCNVCSIDCYDEESFARHMNGKKHREKMELVMSSTSQQAVLIKSRLQAEEHLRQIEDKQKGPATKATKPVPKGKPLETLCKVCDKKFTGAYKDHKDTTDHKAKEDRSKAGCKICNVTTFNTYHDYTKHLQSDWHKKKEKQQSWPACKLCNQKFKSPRKFVQHCKTPHHIQNRRKLQKDDDDEELSELVTLDTVGFEDDSTGEVNKATQDTENSKSVFRKPLPVTSSPKTSRSTSIEEENEVLGIFDPKVAVGKKYIVPVAGYFCKVCHKFYNNETAAKVTHCQSKSHYDRLQKHIEAKKQKSNTEQGAQSVNVEGSQSGKSANTQNTSQSQNGNDSINESLETSQETNIVDLTDTAIEDDDSVTEKDENISIETDTSISKAESDFPTVQIEVSDKPTTPTKPSPRGKQQQQRARRGGGGRGRGARKY